MGKHGPVCRPLSRGDGHCSRYNHDLFRAQGRLARLSIRRFRFQLFDGSTLQKSYPLQKSSCSSGDNFFERVVCCCSYLATDRPSVSPFCGRFSPCFDLSCLCHLCPRAPYFLASNLPDLFAVLSARVRYVQRRSTRSLPSLGESRVARLPNFTVHAVAGMRRARRIFSFTWNTIRPERRN